MDVDDENPFIVDLQGSMPMNDREPQQPPLQQADNVIREAEAAKIRILHCTR